MTELLEGETLRERLQAGPLPWRQAVEFGAAIAEGLAAAHARGIIHRDLKPENLFLTSEGRVKILDFGLARVETPKPLTAETAAYAPIQTESGVIVGTVGYMSPEQIRGQLVDCRSDLFSLGCVLYEMVAGQRAFGGDSAADVMVAALGQEPPDLTRLVSTVPDTVKRVIHRCLEKQPSARYQSAGDVTHDLRVLLNTSQRPHTRRPRRTILFGLALVLLLIGATFFLPRFFKPEDDPTPTNDRQATLDAIAVLPFENGSMNPDAEHLSHGLSESIINSLSSLKKVKVRPFSSVARYRGQKLDLTAVGKELKVQVVLTGRVAKPGDQLSVSVELVNIVEDRQLWGERFNRKFADVFAIQEEIARTITEKLRLHLTGEEEKRLVYRHTENIEAFQLYLRGRHLLNNSSGQEAVRKALDAFEQAIVKDSKYAMPHVGMAEAYYWLSNVYEAPVHVIPKAKEAAQRALKLDDQLGDAHALVGLFHALYDWDSSAAERSFRRALELSPLSPTVRMYHALTLVPARRFDEAMAEARKSRELDPSSSLLAISSVFPAYLSRNYEEALSQLKTVLDVDPKNFFPYTYLGLVQEQLDPVKAVAAFEKAAELEENTELKSQLAHAYTLVKREADARTLLAELKALVKKQYVSPYNLAVVHVGLGEKDEAFVLLQKAAEEHAEWFSYLGVDPRLDPIRKDPRYVELLKLLRLEK